MNEKIAEIRKDLNEGKARKATVRELLGWFGVQRRGVSVVRQVNDAMRTSGISSEPAFTDTWLDGEINFYLFPAEQTATVEPIGEGVPSSSRDNAAEPVFRDAAFNVGSLPAANRKPVSVAPDDPIERAMALMAMNDFSQLPVLNGEFNCKGAISWKSIGTRMASAAEVKVVRDAMDGVDQVLSSDSIFSAVSRIIESDFVVVKSAWDHKIAGIVTAADLGEQFQMISQPFLLLRQIEYHIRNLLDGGFTQEELKAACDPNDTTRQSSAKSADDLTFGEYLRLLENGSNWSKLSVATDHKVFRQGLAEIHRIRNTVMHFDPEGVGDDDLRRLKTFSQYLEMLERLKVKDDAVVDDIATGSRRAIRKLGGRRLENSQEYDKRG